MKRPKNQVGGRKEAAPLIAAGRESQGSDQARIYVPADAEYAYYRELLQGYLEKLTRWYEIAREFEKNILPDAEKRHPDDEHYAGSFFVLQTPDGLAVRPDPRFGGSPHPDLVLKIFTRKRGNASENHFSSDIAFHPGPAGKLLLVDADNTPVNEVEIIVWSLIPRRESSLSRKLSISAAYPGTNPYTVRESYVAYEFKDNMLQISHDGGTEPMSDAFATHLFNTIDALIPGSHPITPQSGRRTPEQQAPRPLPEPRRGRQ